MEIGIKITIFTLYLTFLRLFTLLIENRISIFPLSIEHQTLNASPNSPSTILDARFPFTGIRISLLIDRGTISLRQVIRKISHINKPISAGMETQSMPFSTKPKPHIFIPIWPDVCSETMRVSVFVFSLIGTAIWP